MLRLSNFICGVLLPILILASCRDKERSNTHTPIDVQSSSPFEVRSTIFHSTDAFTQGLVFNRDKIIESTGGDSSWIAEYNVTTYDYSKKVVLNKIHFGEGITVLNNKLFQLTWKSNVGFIYDANTYHKIGEFKYNFEGWGITHDNNHLIISDGTDKLHYFDTLLLKEVFTKAVKDKDSKATNLNELEFIEGKIYANQWKSSLILKIDTGTFEVVKKYDFGSLVRDIERRNPDADVLNGIAYNSITKDVFITGKLWPHMYVIRFLE